MECTSAGVGVQSGQPETPHRPNVRIPVHQAQWAGRAALARVLGSRTKPKQLRRHDFAHLSATELLAQWPPAPAVKAESGAVITKAGSAMAASQ